MAVAGTPLAASGLHLPWIKPPRGESACNRKRLSRFKCPGIFRRVGTAFRKASKTVKPIAEGAANVAAEAAIARVLGAERDAREATVRAQHEVQQIAEDARSAARSVAERTERRIRAVTGAFEREGAVRLAEIDAEAARLDSAQPLSPPELAALRRAVGSLARELIGAPR